MGVTCRHPDVPRAGEEVRTCTLCLDQLSEEKAGPCAQRGSISMVLEDGEVIEQM